MVRELLTQIRSWFSGESDTDAAASRVQEPDKGHGGTEADARPEASSLSVAEFLDREHITKQEIYLHTGWDPDEFLVAVVDEHGGQIWQRELVEVTGWPESRVSHELTQLEEDQSLERLRFGREKLVFLPGHGPEIE